jgi:hypothetical protein
LKNYNCKLVFLFFILKFAALLKQQGLSSKGASKGTVNSEESPPLLEEGGKLEVLSLFSDINKTGRVYQELKNRGGQY